MTENLLNRAQLLINQRRYQEAVDLLEQLLNQDPNNAHLLASMAEVHLELDNDDRALNLVDSALAQDPSWSSLYYIKARVLLRKKQLDGAEDCLLNATTIDPQDADYFALWAAIKLDRKQFQEAYNLANKSLELDAENLAGLNIRSRAQLKLDLKDESFATIEHALKEDPTNAYTHANLGWNYLEQGDPKNALTHFEEALRHDPNLDFAQAGMMEALKARYTLYRWFLKYSFWMGNLTAKYQWGVIIGFYVLFRGVRYLARNNESLTPFLMPVLFIMFLIAFSTWVIAPISNLFLRLNRYGQHLLSKKEKLSSNLVAVSFVVCLLGLIGLVFVDIRWMTLAVFGFTMMVPLGSLFAPTTFKHGLLIYAVVLALVGVMAILITFGGGELVNMFSAAYLLGFVAYQWVANFLLIREDNQ